MLTVENLHLHYGDAQALAEVSLDVPQGEIVAIVGANGAGKSSLIRTIAGMHKPRSKGTISPGCRVTGSATWGSAKSPKDAKFFPP